MKQPLTACDRCGLRAVRHELEQRGVIVRFCDECYWDEVGQPEAAETAQDKTPEQPSQGRESAA